MPNSKKELKETEEENKKVKNTKSKSKSVESKKANKKTDKKLGKKEVNKTTKKQTNKKVEKSKKDKTKEDKKHEYLMEYYDLPYKYNETVVKILVQTPKRLFVYWEVSEKDKKTYLNAFGEDFFNQTYPVLLVHNEELNYTFEVPINDFANSWYLDIKDPKTKYVVQLGRKFRNAKEIKAIPEVVQKEHIDLRNDFVYITDSNKLEAPNDHILFEKLPNQITYRNVKTGEENKKDISDIFEKLDEHYKENKLKEMYKELYGESTFEEDIIGNPSSGGLSSSGQW